MKEMPAKLKMRLPAVFALAATLLFWGFYDRYEPAGPMLLDAPAMSDAFKVSGDVSETNGVFRLHVPEGGESAGIRFELPEAVGYSMIRLTGRIRTENVVEGKRSWCSARLLLIQRRADNRWVPAYHALHSESGTIDWTRQVHEFEIEPEAAKAEVVLQQIGVSGTAWYDSISAVPVKLKTSFLWWRAAFALFWIAVGVLYYRRGRLDRRRLRILILLNVFAILYGTLLPGKWISKRTDQAKETVVKFMQEKQDSRAEKTDAPPAAAPKEKKHKMRFEQTRIGQFEQLIGGTHRLGHFVLFAVLCFLVYCSAALEGQAAVYYFKVAFDLLLFAAASESLQHLTLDRTPGLSDWLMDVYGMASAFILFLLVRALVFFFRKHGKASRVIGV